MRKLAVSIENSDWLQGRAVMCCDGSTEQMSKSYSQVGEQMIWKLLEGNYCVESFAILCSVGDPADSWNFVKSDGEVKRLKFELFSEHYTYMMVLRDYELRKKL